MNSTLEIIQTIATEQGVTVEQILSPLRSKPVTRARHMAMAAIRVARPQLSLPVIGRMFGRDHTSVLHGIRRANKDRRSAEKLAQMKARGRA